MPAAYDNYDYPSYWRGRDYEHYSEFIALKSFLSQIKSIRSIIEIGAGFGRLVPTYAFRAKQITLADPSAKLLSLARKKFKRNKKITYQHSSIKTLEENRTNKKYDLCIMVRVLHHIENIDEAVKIVSNLLRKKGYFILEFANKSNLKATFRHFLQGDMTYPLNIFPIDLRSKKYIKNNTIPFINYHPDLIFSVLENNNFEIISVRSVSNIRSTLLKRIFPLSFLLELERLLQVFLGKVKFGPSIFILCKRRDI